jgi:hypothetical protein
VGWHKSWLCCENHEPNLPSFVGRLPEFNGTYSEELIAAKLPIVAAHANRVSDMKRHDLTGVCVAANWLAYWVTPLRKHVHPAWEYSGLQDPTRETSNNLGVRKVVKLLQETFTNTSS